MPQISEETVDGYQNDKTLSISYQEVAVQGAEYYLMSDVEIKTTNKVVECGSGDMPGECSDVVAYTNTGIRRMANEATYTMKSNTWYKTVDTNINVVYSKIGNLYAMAKLNDEYTEKVSYTVENIDSLGPNCSFSTLMYIGKGKEGKIELECTDLEGGLPSQKLKLDMLNIGSNIEIVNISNPIEIENGYKYEITLKGLNKGTDQIELKENSIKDIFGNRNLSSLSNIINITEVEVTEDDIEIDLAIKTTSQVNVQNKNVSYEILDTSVASVSSTGNVTGIKPGVTKLKITELDGGNEKEINVVVTKTITITYEKVTGVISIGKEQDSCIITSGNTCQVTLPSIIYDEPKYIENGWYNETTKLGNPGEIIDVSNNLTITAKSTKNYYVVTYNGTINGGTTNILTDDVVVGDLINLNVEATKEGWTFVGWNTSSSATSGLTSLRMSESDITLYAIYRKEAITLTTSYSKGVGIASIGTTSNSCTIAAVYNTATQGTSCSVTLPSISADSSSSVVGWYNGTTRVGGAGNSYTISSDVSLTAQGITTPSIIQTSVSQESGYSWAKSRTYTITYTANSTIGTKYYYKIDNGNWIETTNTSQSVTFTSNGTLYAKTVDNLNNSKETSYTVTYTDSTKPSASIVASVSNNSITINASASSDGESEIKTYYYSKDGGSSWSSSTNSSYTFNNLSDGSYNLAVKVTNNAGNTSSNATTTAVIAYSNVYVSSSGNDSSGNGSSSSPYATIAKAYSKVVSGGTINLLSNITQSSTASFNISGKSATLKGNGTSTYTITRASSLTNSMLTISNSNTVTITNVTFDGNSVVTSSPIITENGSSILNLNSGATVKNGINNSDYIGAGVVVTGNSTVNINGATITNNRATGTYGQGGGLYISGGTATINSGTISYNHAKSDGGGILNWQGTVNLKGGTVNNNSTEGRGGGIWNECGVASSTVKFAMTGGNVTYNSSSSLGGGIYVSRTTTSCSVDYSVSGGNITYNSGSYGAGIDVYNSTFILTNATISNNSTPDGGGGLNCEGTSICTLKSGNISSNTADRGGGIHVSQTSVVNLNGTNITDNTGTSFGGGIAIYMNGTVNMTAGTIAGNKATTWDGGGMFFENESTGILSGGIIKENIAGSIGGGIMFKESATSTLSGVNITYNNSLYGGGIGVYDSTNVTMTSGYIQNNYASENAGGVQISKEGVFNLKGGSIINNSSNGTGGVSLWGGTYNYISGTLSNNLPNDKDF